MKFEFVNQKEHYNAKIKVIIFYFAVPFFNNINLLKGGFYEKIYRNCNGLCCFSI